MTNPNAYRVFLTRNSEYHVRDGLCCGVRDRRTGGFVDTHPALGLPLSDTYVDELGVMRSARTPLVGEPLTFEGSGKTLTTSVLLSIEARDRSGSAALWAQMISRRPQGQALDTL